MENVKYIKSLILENISNQNIVFLSDNKELIKILKKDYSQIFSKIIILDDKTEGLFEILKNDTAYDIIITDFKSGYSIKRVMPNVKILVIDDKENFQYKHIILDDFVSIPVDDKDFYNALYYLTSMIAEKKELEHYINSLESDIAEMNCKVCRAINTSKNMVEVKDKVFSFIAPACKFNRNSFVCEMEEKENKDKKISQIPVKEQKIVEVGNNNYEHHNIRFSLNEEQKIDAETFVADLSDMEFEKVDFLKEELEKFTIFLNNAYSKKVEEVYLDKEYISSIFYEVYKIIDTFYTFKVLALTFEEFSSFIENISFEDLKRDDNKKMLIDSLLLIIDDLIDWIDVVFFKKNTDNVNYLDASFASNCKQIKEMFEVKEVTEDNDDDLEFF